MTVKDFAEMKIRELQAAGNKQVTVKEARPCELDRNSYSYDLFSNETVPENAEVILEWDRSKNQKGVMLWVSFVRPRCRKATVDSFRTALA